MLRMPIYPLVMVEVEVTAIVMAAVVMVVVLGVVTEVMPIKLKDIAFVTAYGQ
jgi:hypothetical protein